MEKKRDAWAHFADIYEAALRSWPEDITNGFHPKSIIRVFETLHLYDKGLSELAVGNRQVWQKKTGYFYQLIRPVDLIRSFFYTPCHERWSQVEAYPPEIEKINKLRLASNFKGDHLLYPTQNNLIHFYDAAYLLAPENYQWEFEIEPYPVFPPTLPPVPERSDILIKTGELVPCDGIWEPVDIQYNHKFLVIKTDIKGFKNQGAYNYFIRGMRAPLSIYLDNLQEDGWGYQDVHWRLIWEDNRYCDGVIPDESEYFLDEEKVWGKRITCNSGEVCPYSGRWATIAGDHQQFIEVEKGQVMPEATQYKSDIYTPDIKIRAVWTLLSRDDEGSVYQSQN